MARGGRRSGAGQAPAQALERQRFRVLVRHNNERYHEALDNVTPADAYFGRRHAVVSEREKIKKRTMRKRKKEYLAARAD